MARCVALHARAIQESKCRSLRRQRIRRVAGHTDGSPLPIVITRRKGAHRRESADVHRRNRRLGPRKSSYRQRHVVILKESRWNEPRRASVAVADSARARHSERNVPARQIHNRGRNKEREIFPGPPVIQLEVIALDDRRTRRCRSQYNTADFVQGQTAPASIAPASPQKSRRQRDRMKRPIFLSSFFSIHWKGSKFFTSPAMVHQSQWVSKCVIGPMPLTPARRFFQLSSVPMPNAQTSPTP